MCGTRANTIFEFVVVIIIAIFAQSTEHSQNHLKLFISKRHKTPMQQQNCVAFMESYYKWARTHSLQIINVVQSIKEYLLNDFVYIIVEEEQKKKKIQHLQQQRPNVCVRCACLCIRMFVHLVRRLYEYASSFSSPACNNSEYIINTWFDKILAYIRLKLLWLIRLKTYLFLLSSFFILASQSLLLGEDFQSF